MLKIISISLTLILGLSACANSSIFTKTDNNSYNDPSKSRSWYPLPVRGSEITVTTQPDGVVIQATVVDSYHAASGRSCSLYSIHGNNSPTGLACRDTDHWIALPFIINPEARTDNG